MDDGCQIEERVLSFTARQWPIGKRRKLTTATRLAQDLGMDGDDAVEFFERFRQEFQVDLANLDIHWNQHFVPEGGPSFAVMIVIGLCVTAGFWLRDGIGIFPAWAWGIVLIALAFLIHNWLTKDTMIPVTLGDLVESVRLGRWNKPYLGTC